MTVIATQATVQDAPTANGPVDRGASGDARHAEGRAWLAQQVRWEARIEVLREQHDAAAR
jgi:hypothetical protein